MRSENRTGVIGFLFVLSGLLGLVYQIVWFKYLSAFLGNTTYAQSIVLATFMGGMAIGASVWGRRADRARSPLLVYGWLEIAIGGFCALYPFLLGIVRRGFVGTMVGTEMTGESAGVLVAKIIVSIIMLLPPTIMMGGTLPVVVRALTGRFEHAGKIIATLYALNSMGAVMGSILGGFFFVRLAGLQASILTAAVLSIAVGGVALVVGNVKHHEAGEDTKKGSDTVYDNSQRRLATIIAGISGGAAMILEVAWVRMLIPILGSSTYSFSLMLIAFISGITLGGMYAGRVCERSRNLVRWLMAAQVAIVLSVALSLAAYDRLPYMMWHLSSILSRSVTTYPVFLSLEFIVCLVWMIVPTFFFGLSLPVAIRIASKGRDSLGTSVGTVYTVNTAGTVVGSLLAGFVFIPWIGLTGSVLVAMIALTLNVLLIILMLPGVAPVRTKAIAVGVAAAAFLLAGFMSTDASVPSLTGVFRLINKNRKPPASYADFVSTYAPSDILYYDEGVSATVGVVGSETPEGKENVLIINGKSDASSLSDLPTQLLLGHLPALLHGHAKNALVVGYGSGATVGGLLRYDLERLDCVEISPEVAEASGYFDDVNGNPLTDTRFNLVIDDAASFIELSRRTYDLIVSEPSNPWIAGIGSLYTTEFFERCKQVMTPNGIMSQWLHMYEIDDETFRLVVRTFADVFPYVTLWKSMSADILLIGSLRPIDVSTGDLQIRMDRPGVGTDLRKIGIEKAVTLLSLQVMSERNVHAYAGEGLLNTEDHPILEFLAPRAFFVNTGVTDMDDHDERRMHPGADTYLARNLKAKPLATDDIRSIGMYHADDRKGDPVLAYNLLRGYLSKKTDDGGVLRTLVRLAHTLGLPSDKRMYLKILADLSPEEPSVQSEYGWAYFEDQMATSSSLTGMSTDEAELRIRRAISLAKDTVDTYRTRLADLYYAMGRYALAMDQYARAIQIRESHTRDPYIASDNLFTRLAQCLYYTGDTTRALGYALQAVNMNPSNGEARSLILTLWDGDPSLR